MSTVNWTVVNDAGLIQRTTTVPILRHLDEGERLSAILRYPGISFTRVSTIRLEGAEGCLIYDVMPTIRVVGETYQAVQEVIRRLEEELGVVDLTPDKPMGLPSFGSFFRRVKFLFWDYPVRGKTSEVDLVDEVPNA